MTDTVENEHLKTATEMMQRDSRFHAIAMSCVASAMHQFYERRIEEIEPRDVHDVALEAVATLLKRIYTEDAEIVALRTERDLYKERALLPGGLWPILSIDDRR